jgi:hypothetical protein
VLQGTLCQQGLAAGIGSDTMNCMYLIGHSPEFSVFQLVCYKFGYLLVNYLCIVQFCYKTTCTSFSCHSLVSNSDYVYDYDYNWFIQYAW